MTAETAKFWCLICRADSAGMRTAFKCCSLSLLIFFLADFAPASDELAVPTPVLPDSDIRQILVNRIDRDKRGVGIVVGLIDARGRRIIAYGGLEKGDKRPLDGDSIFEIGSVTKVFTALLAADMAERGEIRLDDPIAKYLPPSVNVPRRKGRQITIIDLATHTSGLPRTLQDIRPKTPVSPMGDYGLDELYSLLSSYELPRDIGSKYQYSNLGFGLLGLGLARRAGTDYESLVETRIAGPLRMRDTRITLTPQMQERLVAGHNGALMTIRSGSTPTLGAAGALRSTANDLLIFLSAALGYTDSVLSAPMRTLLATRRPTGEPLIDVAMAWNVDTRKGEEIIWKNGTTGGYRAFIGYDARSRVGVVALSNATTEPGVDDIALHLLDPRYPLAAFPGAAAHRDAR
jgi:serine-type D-Ala-D-Ala carboxypeptidase/endopeptidase